MRLVKSAIAEIEPSLELSKSEMDALKRARIICAKARELTTTSADEDSIWTDAELALNAVIDEQPAAPARQA